MDRLGSLEQVRAVDVNKSIMCLSVAKWPRPPLADWLKKGTTIENLAFQLVDIDFYQGI